MRSRRRMKRLVMATVPAAVVMGAVPAGLAAAAVQSGSTAGGAEHEFVIILRNQNSQLGARSTARRAAAVAEQRPVLSQLRVLGGREVGATSLVNAVFAKMTAAKAAALAANPGVAEIVPNVVIHGPSPVGAQPGASGAGKVAEPPIEPRLCGTSSDPQLNPEALFSIHSVQANRMGADGAGVTVALMADGLNPANPDFQRNAAFATASSPPRSPIVTQEDFSGSA